jgi:hypothetical protein
VVLNRVVRGVMVVAVMVPGARERWAGKHQQEE